MMNEKMIIESAVNAFRTLPSDVRENYENGKLYLAVLDRMHDSYADGETVDAWAERIAVARVLFNKSAVNLNSFKDSEQRDEYARTFNALWLHITRMHDALSDGDAVGADIHRWHAHDEWKELIRRCVPSYKTDENDIFRFEGRIYGVGGKKERFKTYTVMSDGSFRKYIETLLGCMMDGEQVEYGKKRASAENKKARFESRAQARNMTKTANGENK